MSGFPFSVMEPTGCCTSPQLGGGGTMPPVIQPPPLHPYTRLVAPHTARRRCSLECVFSSPQDTALGNA